MHHDSLSIIKIRLAGRRFYCVKDQEEEQIRDQYSLNAKQKNRSNIDPKRRQVIEQWSKLCHARVDYLTRIRTMWLSNECTNKKNWLFSGSLLWLKNPTVQEEKTLGNGKYRPCRPLYKTLQKWQIERMQIADK